MKRPLQNGATPAQYACDPNDADAVVNVCNDAQHIDYQAFDIPNPPGVSCSATTTTAGIATDSCVDSCRYQGSCPYGFACVGVGSVGSSRIGLCLPTGGGEVGAPCSHDGDCVFGYCPSAAAPHTVGTARATACARVGPRARRRAGPRSRERLSGVASSGARPDGNRAASAQVAPPRACGSLHVSIIRKREGAGPILINFNRGASCVRAAVNGRCKSGPDGVTGSSREMIS